MIDKFAMITILVVFSFLMGTMVYSNMKIKAENQALKKELSRNQEIFLEYSREKMFSITKKNQALGALQNDEDILKKFNTINNHLF